jgi:uncharacterized membrane protein HdeD (DUF308 family)
VKLLLTLLDQLRKQPAAYAVTGLGAVGAVIIAFGHLTVTEAALVSGAFTAIGTIVTAIYARPVNFTMIAGAAAVLLQSLVLFNVHLSSGEIAAVVGTVNFVLGIIAVPTIAEPLAAIRARETPVAPAELIASAVGGFPGIGTDELARKIAVRLSDPGFR